MTAYERIKANPEALAKRKAYHAQWQRNNKEKVKAYNAAHYAKQKAQDSLYRYSRRVNPGDTIYYCYDLFGEHLIEECTVEEILLDRKGIKALKARNTHGTSWYCFASEGCTHTLNEVAFTQEEANKWLESH